MAYLAEHILKDGTIRYRARERAGGRGSKMLPSKVTGYKSTAKQKLKGLEDVKIFGEDELKPQKTKIKEVYKYNKVGNTNNYGLRITLENGLVTGWDDKR